MVGGGRSGAGGCGACPVAGSCCGSGTLAAGVFGACEGPGAGGAISPEEAGGAGGTGAFTAGGVAGGVVSFGSPVVFWPAFGTGVSVG